MTDLAAGLTPPPLARHVISEQIKPSRGLLKRVLPSREPMSDDTVFRLMAIWVVLGTLSQKLSLLLVPGTALQLVLPFEYLLLAILAAGRRLTFSSVRLGLLLLFFGSATLVNLITSPTMTSLLYVYAIYIPLVARVRVSEDTYMRYLRSFQILGVFVAGMVFIDWGFQFVHLPMPNMEHFIPAKIKFFNFNYVQALNWGSKWYKPNAFFFLETSYVAQMVATVLVIELCTFQRFKYLLIFVLAEVLSFGGTGFTLVLVSIPIIVIKMRLRLAVAILALTPVAFAAAVQVGLVDNVASRSAEFDREGSSGNQRFMGQFEAIAESLGKSPSDALLGKGAGKMLQNGVVVWTPLTKVTVEYGLIVSAIYLTLLFTSVFGSRVPFVVGYVSVFQYLFLNGGFLVPVNVFTIVMLTSIFQIRKRDGLAKPPPRALELDRTPPEFLLQASRSG